jgi:photosystem II stability/assembly factor-like uncharacterized protein
MSLREFNHNTIMKVILFLFLFFSVSFCSIYAQENIFVSKLLSIRINCIAINADDVLFIGTWQNGIFRSSDNGDTWNQINSGLPSFNIFALAIDTSEYIFATIYGGYGVYRSTDNGESWEPSLSSSVRRVATNSDGHIFAIGNKIYRSTDHGENWTIPNPDPIPGEFVDATSLLINQSNDYIFVGEVDVYAIRSTDNGQTWAIKNSGLIGSVLSWGFTSNYSFAGNDYGIFRSPDHGDSWFQLMGEAVLSLTVNPVDHIYAGTYYGEIYMSTDNGNTWLQIDNGFTTSYIQTLCINSDGYLFAGTVNGLYRTINNGANWTLLNIPVAIENKFENPPEEFNLKQNYPNPLNPVTIIKYILPKVSDVELIIYNPLGQRIRTLVNQHQPAGIFEVQWDGRDEDGAPVVSGVYIYVLKAGAFSRARKMVLLR